MAVSMIQTYMLPLSHLTASVVPPQAGGQKDAFFPYRQRLLALRISGLNSSKSKSFQYYF